MSKIVCVHGIGQQLKGAASIEAEWMAALLDGLTNAGVAGERVVAPHEVRAAFYGDLFRQSGGRRSSADPPYVAADMSNEWEVKFVAALYNAVQEFERQELDAPDRSRGSVSVGLQNMLLKLCTSEFFGQMGTIALIVGNLKQVYAYLHHDDIKQACSQRVLDAVGDDTRVVIAHSLGSVVAYEALWHQNRQLDLFITLGSPLGVPNLILPYLEPRSDPDRRKWSLWTKRWVNISDDGDVVALAKELAPSFGEVEDLRVSNEVEAHDARPYLTARETGEALATALGLR